MENTYTKYIFHPYNFWSSSLNLAFSCSLFILRAAVTNPDSGVHASGSNLIFAGVSNLSNFAVLAACTHLKNQIKSSSPLCAYYDVLITGMNARKFMKMVEYGVIFTCGLVCFKGNKRIGEYTMQMALWCEYLVWFCQSLTRFKCIMAFFVCARAWIW